MAQNLQNLALTLTMFDPLKITDITGVNRKKIDVFIQIGVNTIEQWSKFQQMVANQLLLMRIFLEQTFLDNVSNIIFRYDNIRKTVFHLIEHFRCKLKLWGAIQQLLDSKHDLEAGTITSLTNLTEQHEVIIQRCRVTPL